MKTTVPTCIRATLLLVGLALPVRAEMVVIHFQTVFEEFYELRIEDQKLRASVQEFQREQEIKVQELQAKQEAFNQLRSRAAQPEVSNEEREQIAEEAVQQLEELNREQQAIQEERNQFQQDLEAKGIRLRRGIVDKVTRKITEMAEARNWTLVLDSSAKAPNGLPVVHFATPAMDMTQVVIRELNASAPVPGDGDQ
ncbi:MAG: OmpH family outer membrane protein [Kiritimatiellia bacterium]